MGARAATVAACALALAAAGCGKAIGGPCNTNVDCDPLGQRFCDISQPGGYCTVEGCDISYNTAGQPVSSCPTDAVCVRFFQPLADRPCNTTLDCAANQRCLCDVGDPTVINVCATDGGGVTVDGGVGDGGSGPFFGHCAPESSERRNCVRFCNTDNDCGRVGYVCVPIGTHGAEQVPTMGVDGGGAGVLPGTPTKYCTQQSS